MVDISQIELRSQRYDVSGHLILQNDLSSSDSSQSYSHIDETAKIQRKLQEKNKLRLEMMKHLYSDLCKSSIIFKYEFQKTFKRMSSMQQQKVEESLALENMI